MRQEALFSAKKVHADAFLIFAIWNSVRTIDKWMTDTNLTRNLLRDGRVTIMELLRSNNPFFAVFFAVLAFEWVCRVRLYFRIYAAAKDSAPIFGFLPSVSSKLELASGFFKDCEYALIVALGIWAACAVSDLPLVRKTSGSRKFRLVILIGSLLIVSFIFCLQYSLITAFHTGLTRGVLAYGIEATKPTWALQFINLTDVSFLLLIVVIYCLHVLLSDRLRTWFRLAMLVAIVASFVIFQLERREERRRQLDISTLSTDSTFTWTVDDRILRNPLGWIVRNAILAPSGNFDARSTRLPGLEQRRTVGFVDPAFAFPSAEISKLASVNQSGPWNVVFFLLEGINTKYVTGSPEQPSIMPFTNQLASHGLVLENHFSSGIDTDYASFSIFTGLYSIPESTNFVDRNDLRFPTLFSAVGPRYSNTFVADTIETIYYPYHLLLNTGLRELWDSSNLPTKRYHAFGISYSDPMETAAFFARRVNAMNEPFVAVYNLEATHWPYFDFDHMGGSQNPGESAKRYKKDVTLVDNQIKLIMSELAASGRADRTIVVITSDHGEAFGEHADDFGHGFSMFNEATHVPMIFYQPRLIMPGRVTTVTSHVDIVPTILDLMGTSYDPLQFQGESAIRMPRRKYVFIYGPKRDIIASISRDRVKVVVDLTSDNCAAFDLNADPQEIRPQSCSAYRQQADDLLEYRNHQLRFLPNYAASCRQSLPCATVAPY